MNGIVKQPCEYYPPIGTRPIMERPGIPMAGQNNAAAISPGGNGDAVTKLGRYNGDAEGFEYDVVKSKVCRPSINHHG